MIFLYLNNYGKNCFDLPETTSKVVSGDSPNLIKKIS